MMNLDHENEFHFMVDLETLATIPSAAITEIGAVAIEGIDAFHTHCYDRLGQRDEDTVQWRYNNNLLWKNEREAPHISVALTEFFNWVEGKANGRPPILWCKGTDFDATIIKSACVNYSLSTPWKYNSIRDLRTLLSFFPQFVIPKSEVTHNALEDAAAQKRQLLQILELVSGHA
jgi:inhibitor of KinA sporulation pathway (predicted exonuclease)